MVLRYPVNAKISLNHKKGVWKKRKAFKLLNILHLRGFEAFPVSVASLKGNNQDFEDLEYFHDELRYLDLRRA